jgi:hypothetical protein
VLFGGLVVIDLSSRNINNKFPELIGVGRALLWCFIGHASNMARPDSIRHHLSIGKISKCVTTHRAVVGT